MPGTGGEKTRRIRNILLLVGALFAVGTGLSLRQEFQQVREDQYQLAVESGKVFFRTIVAMRSPVDSYITGHSEATFSHGICPECAGKLYGWSEKEKPPDA